MATHYEVGRYWAKLAKTALSEASTGTAQLVITFDVQGRIDPANPDGELLPCQNYERSIFRAITEKTINWLMEDLQTLGFEGTSFQQLDPQDQKFIDLKGVEFEVYCNHKTWQGISKEDWSLAGSGGGPPIKPLDAEAVRKLDALFGKRLKEGKKYSEPVAPTAKPVGANSAKQQKVAAESAPADDVPF